MSQQSPGEILAQMVKTKMDGQDTGKLKEELEKETCNFFSKQGTKVDCGKFTAENGDKAIKKD